MTRQGLVGVVAGVIAVLVGRVFGVIELYVIGAAFILAALFAGLYVVLRHPRLRVTRWVHPSLLVAGDTGRVDVHIAHGGALPTPRVELTDAIHRSNAPDQRARLAVGPIRRRSAASAGYQLPTTTRGVITVGPLVIETRDPLGMARRRSVGAGHDDVIVAPRSFAVSMPRLGHGVLGNHLLQRSQRLGPGEFHSLREYVEGDEPRSIHWKASARSENLIVKQHTTEGLRRVTVVLDADARSYRDRAGFERSVTVAASLVNSADRAALTTRFVTAPDIDLRGPDVATHTLRLLARIDTSPTALRALDRDPGEGLGLLVVISGSERGSAWRSAQAAIDPTLTAIPVLTEEPPQSPLGVAARTDDEFVRRWERLAGGERLDVRAAIADTDAATTIGAGR
ncbi:MAG: DUF58 domain-containing protein [Ilumatobacteraceae bacterium]|nr:DUF58 domain-containing protein [Ilumatobacteraceae bacterium]